MFSRVRRHLSTIAVALVAGAVGASAPAVADGVRHALFAHDAGKVDGIDSTDLIKRGQNAGGALTGTYPNPKIRAGAIRSKHIADGSLRASDTFVLSGGISVDPPVVPANECVTATATLPGLRAEDLVQLFPSLNLMDYEPVTVHTFRVADIAQTDTVHYNICNVGTTQANPPSGFWGYTVTRP